MLRPTLRHALPPFFVALALFASGCLFGRAPAQAPRYALRIVRSEDRPAPSPVVATNGLVVVGRSKIAELSRGAGIVWTDEQSGRIGTLADGRWAAPPEMLVKESLRAWLAASGAFGTVSDLGVAPRNSRLTMVEIWIERLCLVRGVDGAWRADADLHILVEPTSTTFLEHALHGSAPVDGKGGTPTAEAATAALSKALGKVFAEFETKL